MGLRVLRFAGNQGPQRTYRGVDVAKTPHANKENAARDDEHQRAKNKQSFYAHDFCSKLFRMDPVTAFPKYDDDGK